MPVPYRARFSFDSNDLGDRDSTSELAMSLRFVSMGNTS